MSLFNLKLKLRGQNNLDGDLLRFETGLFESLSPMEPRHEFTSTLRENLLVRMDNVEFNHSSSTSQMFQTGLLIVSGATGIFVVVLTGLRGLVSFFGVLGLVLSWIKHRPQESFSSSNIST